MAEKLLRALVAVAIAAMATTTVVDVLGRYFLNSPLTGASEIIEICLGLAISAAVPMVSAKGNHITVSLIDGVLSKEAIRVWRRLVDAIALTATILIGIAVWKRTNFLMLTREHMQVLGLLLWPTAALISFMWFVVAAIHAGRLIGWFEAKSDEPQEIL